MHRFRLLGSSLLLIVVAQLNLAAASGGGKIPIYPRICVGPSTNQCCKENYPADFVRICAGQLCLFKGDDTIEAATVQVSLAASVTQVSLTTSSQSTAECKLRNYWASIGADFETIKFFWRTVKITVKGNPNEFTLKGGAAVVRACGNVYVVFGGVESPTGFSSVAVDYDFNGVKTQTNELFLKYYTAAFRDKDNDVIAEAIEQAGDTPGASLYIAGYSAGGLAAIYASVDIQKATGEKPDHIYIFGNTKPGDDAFIKAYDADFGDRTSVWWNKLDINPELPPANGKDQKDLSDNLPGDEKANGAQQSLLTWGTNDKFKMLLAKYYWRVAPANPPNNYANIPEGTCVKASEGSAWYTACPSNPINEKNLKCGLNFGDHDEHKYFVNIKKCVLPTPNRIIRRRRGWFNPSCINDFPVS
eukprot:GHUV01000816.1.p1 GENE.GHUV01000816.1~~GHUV01000816.1.p1  ORF type:complete len:417 (+),score=69.83 GHUV01000816.1:130-1380(+)